MQLQFLGDGGFERAADGDDRRARAAPRERADRPDRRVPTIRRRRSARSSPRTNRSSSSARCTGTSTARCGRRGRTRRRRACHSGDQTRAVYSIRELASPDRRRHADVSGRAAAGRDGLRHDVSCPARARSRPIIRKGRTARVRCRRPRQPGHRTGSEREDRRALGIPLRHSRRRASAGGGDRRQARGFAMIAAPAASDPVDPLFGSVDAFDLLFQYTPPPGTAPPTTTPLVLRV